jgi:plasmid maintenance system antidote protein VapI
VTDRRLSEDHPRDPQADDAGPTLLATVLAEQGVAQADLARRTNLSTKHINLLCQGRARMSVDVALRLEFVLGVDAAEWMRAYTETWINEQRDTVQLAAFQQQLEWWRRARFDDLDQIGRLCDERDEVKFYNEQYGRLLHDLRAHASEAKNDGRTLDPEALLGLLGSDVPIDSKEATGA